MLEDGRAARFGSHATAHFVHPFDDDRFIAGNGTAGLEILEDLPEVDAVIAPLGGGGLLAGIGAAMRAPQAGGEVFAAEPETAAPLATSLDARRGQLLRRVDGVVRRWRRRKVRAADDVAAAQRLVDDSIVVSLDEVRAAMKRTAERVHVIAEGAAACAVAAALSGRAGGGKIVAVVSGGNIDLARFASLVGCLVL